MEKLQEIPRDNQLYSKINNLKTILFLITILFYTNSYSGINENQKKIIKAQLFLMKEGMISKKEVFEKAKLFDSKGFFGINSDVMTQEEFDKFFKEQERRTHH